MEYPTIAQKSFMCRYCKWILAFIICIVLLPYAFFLGKPIHVSVDDVSVFERLFVGAYTDVFDEPFLNILQTLHQRTGAKFTLYVYESSVTDVPDFYWAQIRTNSDWMKIGFHATSAEDPAYQSDDEFITSYNRLDSILSNKAPQNKTNILRLHYWKATTTEISYLRDKGVRVLLSADRDAISYSLSSDDDFKLQTTELLHKDGMCYKTTDFRVENSNIFAALCDNALDEEIVFFTHEWAISGGSKGGV